VQRIVVLGIPGAGKSTFARQLGQKLTLPVHHLDRYFWHPGWKASSQEQFNEALRELLAGDAWILDGNYRRTIPLRLEYADTAILLDVPRRTALRRVMNRIITYRKGGRPDMAEGCPERFVDRDFLMYIWRYHRDVHPETLVYLQAYEREAGGNVVCLHGDRDVAAWLDGVNETRGG
jgi:adenylate kinase family enzyme